jgi:hypothetical protein
MTELDINGKAVSLEVPADTPLLWVLRDELASPARSSDAAWRSVAPAPCTSTGRRRVRVSRRSRQQNNFNDFQVVRMNVAPSDTRADQLRS